MTNPGSLNRRDFLKLLTALGLSMTGFQYLQARQPQTSSEQAGQVEQKPNILILVLDACSASHLSSYDYPRKTTPNIARLVEHATVFHRHYAGGNFTVPGTASILTGVYPWLHRALHLFGTVRNEYASQNLFSALADEYFISAFTHNPHAFGLLNQFGKHLDRITPPNDLAIRSLPFTERFLEKDFPISLLSERVIRGMGGDFPGSLFLSFFGKDLESYTPEDLQRLYHDLYPRGLPSNTLGVFFLLEQAIDWIQSQVLSLQKPFLGYYHLLPPHEPYATRKEFIDIFDDGWSPEPKPSLAFHQDFPESYLSKLRRYYDEYIAFVDSEFGRLYDELDRAGVFEDTYLIVTSDHGQMFERNIHGHLTETLYEPIIRVPLLIAKPGQKEREDILIPTSCVDLMPTLLRIAGKPAPDWGEGQVLPTFDDGNAGTERRIYAVEAKTNLKTAPLSTASVSMMTDRYKLIHYFGYLAKKDDYEFYDLKNDPEELEDLYPSGRKIALEFKDELAAKLGEENRKFV